MKGKSPGRGMICIRDSRKTTLTKPTDTSIIYPPKKDMQSEEFKMTPEEQALIILMRSTGVTPLEAIHFVQEGLKRGGGKLRRAEKCLELGQAEMKKRCKTVSLERAVTATKDAKNGRRSRTRKDFGQTMRRFFRKCPGLSHRRVRSIRSEECEQWINQAFDTPSQRKKARAALSCVFSIALRRRWCDENPVHSVPIPSIKEKSIQILTMPQIESLLSSAVHYKDGICMAAVSIMLYAGVRPHEVARLTWAQVHVDAGVICILPQHSKTGGARQVTLRPPLIRLLRKARKMLPPQSVSSTELVCPHNWRRHWAGVRRAAGWSSDGVPWQPDVLRHTFASHHLAAFHNYNELQVEMGHRDSALLRTRYLSLSEPVDKNIF